MSVPSHVNEILASKNRQYQSSSPMDSISEDVIRPETKILFVDQTGQLGGAELCLKDILLNRRGQDQVILLQHGPFEQHLVAAGCEVHVETMGRLSREIKKNSGLVRKALSAFDSLPVVRTIARFARDKDVIYANTPKALVISALAGALSNKPVIYHLHDILSREHFSRSNLRLLVLLANWFTSYVIANSQASLDAFKRAGGRSKSSVCYNGFDPSVFDQYVQQSAVHRAAIRDELEIDTDTPLIGVFGRLAPWKGQHVAIEALGRLPNVHLLLAGDALFGEETYKHEIHRLAQEPAVKDRIHLLGFRDDVATLMQAVDVVVHCSTEPEPFGRVIVEGMLSRRPVIASRAGGAAEIVEDSVTGLLVEPGNAASLSDCIERMLHHGVERDAMVNKAYQASLAKYEITSIVREIDRIARSVVTHV